MNCFVLLFACLLDHMTMKFMTWLSAYLVHHLQMILVMWVEAVISIQYSHGLGHFKLCYRGKGLKIGQPAITAAGAARSALRAGCKDVPWETVERYNLLKRCVSMLPAGCQAAHESAIMARRHVEYFDPAVMLQVLNKVITT